uniref:Uncharacterized protein n=1 Tax=Oryza glumipatula TaxID=40148 RepID=A0A0E0AZB0_9ORYZ
MSFFLQFQPTCGKRPIGARFSTSGTYSVETNLMFCSNHRATRRGYTGDPPTTVLERENADAHKDQVKGLNGRISKLNGTIKELNDTIEALERQVQNLTRYKEEKQKRHANLQKEFAELERKYRDLDAAHKNCGPTVRFPVFTVGQPYYHHHY